MNDLIVVKGKKDILKNIIIYFFIYSFIGWILETIYAFWVHGHFVNRGFLYGPYCPIYGIGAIILILMLNNSKGKPLQEFIISAIAFTIFEYMASYALEVIFGLRWWDYSEDFLNLQGRVSLAYSVLWGLLGIFLIEGIHPFIKKLINKVKKHINKNLGNTIVIIFVCGIITDLVFSSIKYLK